MTLGILCFPSIASPRVCFFGGSVTPIGRGGVTVVKHEATEKKIQKRKERKGSERNGRENTEKKRKEGKGKERNGREGEKRREQKGGGGGETWSVDNSRLPLLRERFSDSYLPPADPSPGGIPSSWKRGRGGGNAVSSRGIHKT